MAVNFRGVMVRSLDRLARLAGRGPALTRVAAWLLGVAVLAVGVTVRDLQQDALASALRNTENLAVVLAEQTARTVQSVDIVLREVQEHIAALPVETPEDFERVLASKAVHDFLRSRVERVPQVDNVALVAANGMRINYSFGWPAATGNMSDRDYARHFAAADDANLFISEPVVSRATNVWTIFLVRRVSSASGRYLGMVLASIPLQVFVDLVGSINLPDKESFMLLRRDGVVLVRHPDTTERAGQKMPPESAWYELIAQGGGHYESPGYFDGTVRIVAVRPLSGYPLAVNVGIAKSTALAYWRREAMLIVAGTICAAGCLLWLLRGLGHQFRRLEKSKAALTLRNEKLIEAAAALRESDARLAATSSELSTTLASMDQGLMMVDAGGTVAVCNDRAIKMLELPPSLMASRPLFRAVVDAEAGEQESRTARTPLQDLVYADNAWTIPRSYERQLPNGRIVEVRRVPLAGGGWVATYDDITARRHAEEQVVFMARHDALTRLPNRIAFVERLEQTVAHASRSAPAAVLCLDLDHFKGVNDTLGHPVGDHLLRLVADRLSACVREVDTVARFGGDEFAVIQVGPEREEDVALLARRIIETLSLPYDVDEHQVVVGVSIGVALVPADGADPDTLLKNADIALYRAKEDGRGVFRFFEAAMDARLQERRALELDLHRALVNHEFEVFYQPLVDLLSDRICGFEALLRWHHPVRGLLEPCEFVPLAEEIGLIIPIGEWVLHEACREAARWPDGIRVAVNISAVQFRTRDVVRVIVHTLESSGLSGDRLDLEITEGVLLQNNHEVLGILHELRQLGLRISMDDFGTGYSSLSYLRSFPFDKIKIDQSFIRDLPMSEEAVAIVRAVTRLGSSLGMETTAEGVETAAQLARLRVEGCTEVQGFFFSQPQPAGEVPRLLRQHNQVAIAAG